MERHGGNKSILLSEKNQSEKVTYYMISTIWDYGNEKIMEAVKISVVVRSLEEGRDI